MLSLSPFKNIKNVTPTFAELIKNNLADSHLRANQKTVN